MRAAQMVTLGAIALAACSGASTRNPRAGLEPQRWDEMSYADRLSYMSTTVMPEMKAVFTTFDRHRYDKMTCATCHGHDGEARRWKMPNPDLLLEPEALAPTHPSAMDVFMNAKVAKEMCRLLGKSDFACFGCHTQDR